MKKALSLTLLGIVVAAMAITPPTISWDKKVLEVGEVKKGESIDLVFTFTNDGESPVQILEAKGSCGCTKISYTDEAIEPGKSTKIMATFSSGKLGAFSKSVTVKTSDQDTPTVLRFKGVVVE